MFHYFDDVPIVMLCKKKLSVAEVMSNLVREVFRMVHHLLLLTEVTLVYLYLFKGAVYPSSPT